MTAEAAGREEVNGDKTCGRPRLHAGFWTMTSAACMLAVAAVEGWAQSGGPPEVVRSSRSGVYSEEQAARGRVVYEGACIGCHTPAAHSAPAFVREWGGKPLAYLFQFLRDAMPREEPGSLTEREYLDVTAYLLQINGMPAGRDELPADAAALGRIRFDMAPPPR